MGDGNVLSLDCGDGYTGVCVCVCVYLLKHQNVHLKWVHFCLMCIIPQYNKVD